jgi:phosphohistidine phosphatase
VTRNGARGVKIYIMRHGPAEDHARSGRDFDRRLTASGRARTELVARGLGERNEEPKRIVSSPLARTLETAEVVIASLHLKIEIEARDELAPGGNAMALVRELAATGARRVMLVGHEPDVSGLAAHLVPGWSRGFDKAMVVGLKLDRAALSGESNDDAVGEVRFVIEPKRLGN